LIIYEINQRFLNDVSFHYPNDKEKLGRMSIIEESGEKFVRMANLAIVGSFSVNGVAALHTELLKAGIFKEFYDMEPKKFNNKTNGVTPRRWLKKSNPALSALITEKIGSGWIKNLEQLRGLEAFKDDGDFIGRWKEVKKANKLTLAEIIKDRTGNIVDPDSMFDVQVKRIHEYKRQLLNLLHAITLYNRIKEGRADGMTPRTIIFGGKAAPGYHRAKEIIHLINAVGYRINQDKEVSALLKVIYLPNYGVSMAEKIFPGSDLSEQISTAGMEASGTGNMKFSLNGALTIGTLDGANIEIKEEVGEENIFIFGKTEEQIQQLRRRGYNPHDHYEKDRELRKVLDLIKGGFCSYAGQSGCFEPIFNALVHHGDYYCNLADYRSYIECQDRVADFFKDQNAWHRMAILNVARMAKFSSDRVIGQYADEIWGVGACAVNI
jgi:starch phosphorylase